MKVLYLTNIPAPYRVSFFNELGKMCDLTVLFERSDANDRNNQWFENKNDNYKAFYLKGKKLRADSAISIEVLKYLKKDSYNLIVVGGYSTATGMLAINYMKLIGIPFIINADGGLVNREEHWFKRAIKKYYISSADYWLSTANETSEYLNYYGADSKRIFLYPFTSIQEESVLRTPIDQKMKKRYKLKLNISEEKNILSIGQFIYRKGFDVLLNACVSLPKNYGVYIIGGEPTKEYLILKEKLNLSNVHFINFKTKKELEEYYLASDLFVLPTREDIWGLVINEAMSYGLPIITTNKCVAGLELVKNGENGYIVPANDIGRLAKRINEVLESDIISENMSNNNLNKIKGYTIENMAIEHINIFKTIINNRKKSDK
ncbi:glycosyltransferase family 4 protein [Bacillus sp. SD075]|uniref:glycosyltransferase family 4 protein n=1 Tax=Bacillus sp. SD075 TaxID=2781732 RepID=UPI001A9614CD|nr:glycosyltransferase family 4 protein [Bacillus sp. SD075]MBO0996443.1 glycosyltransferase family 4 protein [Bacillus sp. SD075]